MAFACCRWPPTRDDRQRIRGAAAKVADWDRFVRIVRRNRIAPLVQHALDRTGCEPPGDVLRDLLQRSRTTARQALAMARESLHLQQAFDAAGLPVMVVKGIPLTVLAYGQLGAKESCDIDLLTSPEAVIEATRLLGEFGFGGSLTRFTEAQLRTFIRHSKEAEFHHPGKRIVVDLHWTLVDQSTLLHGIDITSSTQDVPIAGNALRTLATDELFAYLCVHGAIHCWSRIKWLADLNALIGPEGELELERLHRTAAGLGAERSASVALVLCHDLLGLKLRDAFITSLRRDRAVRALCRNVIACLSHRGGIEEHSRFTIPWARTLMAQFFLAPGLGHAVAQARSFWNTPIDQLNTPLPPGLAFLYPVLRFPLWIGRAGKDVIQVLRRRTPPR